MGGEELERVAEWMLERLFVRRDCYGLSTADGLVTVKRPVTTETILGHLRGWYEVGAHVTVPGESRCLWLCIDCDRPAALRAHAETCRVFPREATMLELTGGRGAHVWLLFRTKVPSEIAYVIAHAIARRVPGAEAFPKQPYLPSGYGHFVRVPLGMRQSTGRWSKLLWPKSVFDVEPCLPGDYIRIDRLDVPPVPWQVRRERCVFRRGETCLHDLDFPGDCVPERCPAMRR